MVALPILEGEKVKREGRDLSVLRNSESAARILVADVKQNFKTNLSNNFAFCLDGQDMGEFL